MTKAKAFWMILGPDREVLAFINNDACGYESREDALKQLHMEDCFIGGQEVYLEVKVKP